MAVTTRGDISADLVVLACQRRSLEIYRFNSEDYPRRIGVHIDPAVPREASLLLPAGQSVNIGAARGIWLRRPQWPEITTTVTDEHDRQLALQESVAAAGGLWRLLDDRCVSPSDALQAARWKVPQLNRAQRLGFRVPRTVITSSRSLAEAFVESGSTVIKAIQDAYARVGTVLLTGYTERLSSGNANGTAGYPTLSGIDGVCPVLLQHEVIKQADCRVTVIGRRVFPIRIMAPPDAPVDIRAVPPADCTMTRTTLPAKLESACLQFVREAGLRFAALDLAQDADGEYWFLECNPNGQWGWLESATGAPMTDALVDLLLQEVKP